MTYLKTLHPYPAMIADELAASLAQRFVDVGSLVLDPFCGTGRTLMAAAERGGKCLGLDVNPLAVLVANAKAGSYDVKRLDDIVAGIPKEGCRGVPAKLDLEPGRRVPWFSKDARRELAQIIGWINRQGLDPPELFLIATVLSATARDVCLCRKEQWKLHRMNEVKRRAYHRSAWRVFLYKISNVVKELRQTRQPIGQVEAVQGEAKDVTSFLPPAWRERVDVVFTSPPYGDSRTTVGYGGVSGICLGVVRNIRGLEDIFLTGGEIDCRCLGGSSLASREVEFEPSCYWSGDISSKAGERVRRFLCDLFDSCNAVVDSLRYHGVAIFVISRRRVDNQLLYLDSFLIEVLRRRGVNLVEQSLRCVAGKRTPLLVHSKARACRVSDEKTPFTPTMTEEIVQVFRKDVSGGRVR